MIDRDGRWKFLFAGVFGTRTRVHTRGIVYPNSKLEINEFASAIKRAVICCWRGWRYAIRDHTHPSPAFPPIPPPFLLEKYEMAARW